MPKVAFPIPALTQTEHVSQPELVLIRALSNILEALQALAFGSISVIGAGGVLLRAEWQVGAKVGHAFTTGSTT